MTVDYDNLPYFEVAFINQLFFFFKFDIFIGHTPSHGKTTVEVYYPTSYTL